MRLFPKSRLKIYIGLHNYLYRKINLIATKFENGTHPKHRLTKYYQFFINNISENSSILDIGCGIGYVAYKLADKAKFILAIDIEKNSIEIAKQKYSKKNIKFNQADIFHHKFTEKFDYIILSNVLEHIKDRRKLLKIVGNLAPILLIRVPMLNRSWLSLYKKELGFEYRLEQSHYIEYTLETFRNEIESAGLKILSYSIQFGEIWAKIKT